MQLYCPRDYKNGKYYFNKYDAFDLMVMVPLVAISAFLSVIGLILGLLIVGTTLILFMPYKIYHNILNRLLVEIRFQLRQKDFLWYGYNFNNYEDD